MCIVTLRILNFSYINGKSNDLVATSKKIQKSRNHGHTIEFKKNNRKIEELEVQFFYSLLPLWIWKKLCKNALAIEFNWKTRSNREIEKFCKDYDDLIVFVI